mmetsp:Transcript_27007/g.58850  ORF Transcript_27007/g.58850 Transcript_27007/m.58850 type:complete len:432 (+) Transcript_27007:438-1733(+)
MLVQWLHRCRPEQLPQLLEVLRHGSNALVLRLREALAYILRTLHVEHLEHVDDGDPVLNPRSPSLQYPWACALVRLPCAPQSEECLQGEDAKAEVVHARKVLLLEARVGVRVDVLKAEGEGHPSGGCPIAGIAGQVRMAPLSTPRARAHCQAEVDEGEVRLFRALAEVNEHVMRGDIAVEGNGLEGAEDAGKLAEQVTHYGGSAVQPPGPLLAAGEMPINELRHIHSLVILVVDAVEPSIERAARNEGHSEAYRATTGRAASSQRTMGHVPGHVVQGLAASGRKHLQHLRLEGGCSESGRVLGGHHLHGNLRGGIALGCQPDHAECATADDLDELEAAVVYVDLVACLVANGLGSKCGNDGAAALFGVALACWRPTLLIGLIASTYAFRRAQRHPGPTPVDLGPAVRVRREELPWGLALLARPIAQYRCRQ